MGEELHGLVVEGGAMRGVRVGGKLLSADRYVLAFGSHSRATIASVSIDIPVYPVKR